MADVIELDKKRQQQQNEKADALQEAKIDVLKRVLQCARCQLKCSRCGTQIEESGEEQNPKLPYPLCSGCEQEHADYIKLSQGKLNAGRYWHNKEWMHVWRTWLQHQQALDQYRNSKEFIKLLDEFESLW